MELDGNAIGGLLQQVFGADVTAAEVTCATCGAAGPVAETVVYLRGAGQRGPLPHLHERAHGHLADPRREVRRPWRSGFAVRALCRLIVTGAFEDQPDGLATDGGHGPGRLEESGVADAVAG